MAKEFSRTRRLGEQIRRELAGMIQRELQDPRLGMVTVASVELSRDLAHARVFVTVLAAHEPVESVLDTLNQSAAWFRHLLGQRLSARVVPDIRFIYDNSVEQGTRISAAIDAAVADDKRKKN